MIHSLGAGGRAGRPWALASVLVQYLLSTYSILGFVLGVKNTVVRERQKRALPFLHSSRECTQ